MKFNFKQIATVLGSALMIGSSVGMAAAASFPAPFVQNGAADVAVVVGANAALSDGVAATNLGSDLATELAAQTASGSSVGAASVSGEAISLDTGSTRIFLNTSINTAKSILTKTDLPQVLGDMTFSGNVDAKLTSTITVLGGSAAGTAGSNKVIFERQPSSSDEPVIGLSLGGSTQALYNVSFTSKAVNFTHADSEGESISLFGRDFVVSTSTDTTSLVLFSSAEEINLVAGGAAANPSATVTIDGTEHTVELVTGTSTTATIAVDGESKEVTEGNSKKINGIDVAVKSVTESTALDTVTATLLVGSNKLTFTNGQAVTQGSDDENVDGTKVHITGGTGAVTKLTVEVFRPDSNNDAVLPGASFVDPVFGSFKVDFAGMSIPLASDARDTISLASSGDKALELTMTDSNSNEKSFTFAYNNSGQSFLGNSNNETIGVIEMANMSRVTGVGSDRFIVLGNEEYGHLVELTNLVNSSSTDYTKDKVRLTDVFSGENYDATFTSEGSGTISIDGKSYTVIMSNTGTTTEEELYVQFKYPAADSADATNFVVFPTIKSASGALVALYEPLTLTMSQINGTATSTSSGTSVFRFPDGDGYTSVTATYAGDINGAGGQWLIGGNAVNLTAVGANYTAVTVGKVTYNFTGSGTVNETTIYVQNPEASSNAALTRPGLIIFEEKDDASNYEAIVVDSENSAGTGTDGYGFNDVMFSSSTMYEKSMKDSDFTQNVDLFGVLATVDGDDSDQKKLTLAFPDNQIYAQLFIGELDSSITAGSVSGGSATELGQVTVYDNEASSVSSKNLIVVGGSCVNSVAATLLGEPACSADFTALTDVAAGEFLLKVFDSPLNSDKLAMLVAGFNAADTSKAITYLTNNAVDTTVDTMLKGTSATEATVVTA
jgi:hypothetical protein